MKLFDSARRILLVGALLVTALCVGVMLTACEGGGTPADTSDTSGEIPGTAADPADTDAPAAENDTEAGTEAETEDPFKPAAKETADFDTGLEITEADGKASVKTASGLIYTAAGYASLRGDKFVVKDDFTVTFEDGAFAEAFNRMRIGYYSAQPMHIFVTYLLDGEEKTEDYYLESGKQLFCGLIDGFEKKTAAGIRTIRMTPCNGKEGQLALYALDTEILEFTAAKTYYIESDRYKLGLSTTWGMTISYLEDKTCDIKNLRNLINMHDSGRLVQQSYYGTYEAQGDFTPGRVGNEDWMYNPVQAGDLKNHGSRIIDIVVGYRSLYVKLQPYDWGQVLWLCPAYMETVYTVDDEKVRVDNRYVEFSNYENPFCGQELPAFYTVSWLNEFAWYDGDKPWTDDKISYNTDIEMVWTETEHLPNFGSYTKIDNTETWCALFSREDNYGIGMFVPNVDYRSVGVYHPADRTKKPNDNSCSYMGASRVIRLKSYEPLEYSYLIACGTVEDIRATFKANKDFAANESLNNNATDRRVPGSSIDMKNIDFSDPANIVCISQPNHNSVEYAYDEEEKAVRLTATAADPYFSLSFMNLDELIYADEYSGIEIEYMIPTTNSNLSGTGFELFLSCGTDVEAVGGKSVKGYYQIDDLYHTVTVDFSKLAFWDGKINKIRWDYLNEVQPGDTVYVKAIRLIP